MQHKPFGIHWFRRDLRVTGNSALQHNIEVNEGRVLGLFCFDSTFLSRPDFSNNRFAFFLESLKSVKQLFQQMGGELLVVDCLPHNTFEKIFKAAAEKPGLVTFNRDYEPFARERDNQIELLFSRSGVKVQTFRDHLIIEPHELLRDGKASYQVYSPYAKKWFDLIRTNPFAKRISKNENAVSELVLLAQGKAAEKKLSISWKNIMKDEFPFHDALYDFQKKNQPGVTVPIPPAGTAAAFLQLQEFKKLKVDAYSQDRDLLPLHGTSKLAMYFKNGSLTTSQALAYLEMGDEPYPSESGRNRFLKEIVWREFYYSILWHHPRVEREAFLQKYIDLEWDNNRDWFKRWCEGRTGFPVIDAAMRQLNTTGWMHNRARMIVASFLTKDLLIDWRWGEQYFMKMLLDGDLAPNNGGWQWAASTGCDPQPYFRIFNPLLQSKKFDPSGDYIRTYVEELRHVKGSMIHAPGNLVKGYPEPIVNHAKQKTLALKRYQAKM